MKRLSTLVALAAGSTLLAAGLATPSFAGSVGTWSFEADSSAPAETTVSAPAQASPAGLKRGEASMGWNNPKSTTDLDSAPLANALTPAAATARVAGIDVASHQGNVNWSYWWGQGKRFAYVKATEGTYYKNPYFPQQYNGSYKVGMVRGSYHFATPNTTSGATQARYFVARGGSWSKDGKTLPGALDIEWNPYGNMCYGKSRTAMVAWIKDFVTTYKSLTKRAPIIYTAKSWWATCTGSSKAFSTVNPLWIADPNNSPPVLFGGWGFHTIWQYGSSPVDKNYFNGSLTRLKALATG